MNHGWSFRGWRCHACLLSVPWMPMPLEDGDVMDDFVHGYICPWTVILRIIVSMDSDSIDNDFMDDDAPHVTVTPNIIIMDIDQCLKSWP